MVDNFSIEILLGRVIGLVIGFSLHEWAHAWAAYQLGDQTAYRQGRLTLNPRAHIEPIGLILAIFAGFGWAKPVPVNPYAFYPNEKRGIVLVALAGPVMNLIIALLVGLVVRFMLLTGAIDLYLGQWLIIESDVTRFFYHVIEAVLVFNLVLCFFNLLPFSPLDGYKIATGVLPREYSDLLIKYERETTLALILLLVIGAMGRFSPLWAVLGPPIKFFFKLFTSIPY
ncbi:MAG: site-2 protease family protein [Anaerolineae bacterium]|nr:site-2 protease family protein [Anaerolineae bacterium]